MTAAAVPIIDGRQRHSERLALLRTLLALAYLASEAFLSPSGLTRTAGGITALFAVYSVGLLASQTNPLVRTHSVKILFADVLFLVLLLFWSTSVVSVALAAAFYAFLVLQSWALQGAREILLPATAVLLVVYGARITAGRVAPLVVTTQSIVFLLVVGGILAFVFSDQRYLVERRIAAIAHRTSGASESGTAAGIQEALRELASSFRCSHALLAFWDERNDHFCLCRFPPDHTRPHVEPELEDNREWSVFRSDKVDVLLNHVPAPDSPSAGGAATAGDLHPHLVRKFQIQSAIGCGLHFEGHLVGRLLLINRPSPFRHHHLRRLRGMAADFTALVRHILVIQAIEYAAAERERYRLAQDFHDGPLQSVISFQMRAHLIRKLLDRNTAEAIRELEQLQELAQKQVTEMRTFVNSMRPVEVDTASLTAAARRLVDDFQKESGVPVTFITGDEPVRTPGKVGVEILQLIREALHNIHKHAQANHVLFSIEQDNSHILIAVNDNGKGFRFGGRYSLEELESLRLGPNSIKQRMRALGGDLMLESKPGHGTNLRMKIPLY